MELTFRENPTADIQDRVCSILLSLSMMAEARNRKIEGKSEVGRVTRQEQEYHYQRAVLNTLRLLGILIGRTALASDTNMAIICETGYDGFRHTISQCEAYLDLADKDEA